jgi:putative transposase
MESQVIIYNDVQKQALKWGKKWPSGYDLQKLTAGSSKLIGLHADSIGRTCLRYERSRRQHKKAFLRWRGKKSLGWVPFKGLNIKPAEGGFKFNGVIYKVWLSRPLPDGAKILDDGSFSQDAKGNWYINIPVRVKCAETHTGKFVGIDLGLKDLAVLSNGEKVGAHRPYRTLEGKLAVAQRARKKRQVKSIQVKISNQRRNYLHKASVDIAKRFGFIAVGNVSPSKLKLTRMAKSVSDAGWADFKNMLAYKTRLRGGRFEEIDEAYTTQTCSACGCLPLSRPRGIAGLEIRQWTCDDCGTVHDRDVNAAQNIARLAHETLAVGAVL